MTKAESALHEIERALEKLEWVRHDAGHLSCQVRHPENYCIPYTPESVLLKLKEVQTILGFAETKLKGISA